MDNRPIDVWIPWPGGYFRNSPVPRGVRYQVMYRNGSVTAPAVAVSYDWAHRGNEYDIVAYRFVS